MNRPIFREKALEKLSSPDNIHEVIQVTSAKSWLAIFALTGLMFAFLGWAIFGEIPKIADGQGIMIQSGGIAEINSLGAGIIREIKVNEGDIVKQGDTIAIIEQPELELHLKNYKAKLKELIERNAEISEINDMKREIEEFQVKLATASYIKSSYEGKIIELVVKKGQLIETGLPVASIEIKNGIQNALEAIIYITPDEGKKVTVGMSVKIAPSTVRVEEHGYIEAEVVKISEYPATRSGMMSVLGNAALVDAFLKGEPPISVRVKLKTDKTYSGYQWTSVEGPEQKIKSGTLCNAYIITETQNPISLVMPFFRNIF